MDHFINLHIWLFFCVVSLFIVPLYLIYKLYFLEENSERSEEFFKVMGKEAQRAYLHRMC